MLCIQLEFEAGPTFTRGFELCRAAVGPFSDHSWQKGAFLQFSMAIRVLDLNLSRGDKNFGNDCKMYEKDFRAAAIWSAIHSLKMGPKFDTTASGIRTGIRCS